MIFDYFKYGCLSPVTDDFDRTDYLEFTSEKEADEWGVRLYDDWYQENKKLFFTDGYPYHGNKLENYFGNLYATMNDYMRTGRMDVDKNLPSYVNIIEKGLTLAPNTDRKLILYRQVCPEMIVQLLVGNKHRPPVPYCERAFLSTSLVKNVCAEKCGCYSDMLRIFVPEGIPSMYANVVVRRDEVELLLPSKMSMKLIRAPYNDRETNKTMYEVQLIS